ncbi:hypothetical protein [Aeromonas veronii]|uniref:hypothetical protein n=1 Tax=Aeromonas veronii TaxID=654 RepID=UPI003D1F760C
MSESQNGKGGEYTPTDEQLMRFELYCTTRLETDKSVLTLATAALGLIVTLLTSSHVKDFCTLIAFVSSALLFVVCVVSVLFIFDFNAKYIASQGSNDKALKILDFVARFTFSLGVVVTLCAAANVSIKNVERNIKETIEMTDKKEQGSNKNQQVSCEFTNQIFIGDSWEGANTILSKPDNKPAQGNTENSKKD